MRKNVVELIGTFFLVLAIGFTGDPVAIGLMLSVMVYSGGHISGAHYNPAVTLAFVCRKRMEIGEGVQYWVSQVVGALLAALVYYLVLNKTFVPAPGADIGLGVVGLLEILGTFALVLVIMSVATASKFEGSYVYGFAIGLTVTALAYMFGDLSGGVFNPAVHLGPMIIDAVLGSGSSLSNVPLYLVAPVVGGLLGSFTYCYLNEES